MPRKSYADTACAPRSCSSFSNAAAGSLLVVNTGNGRDIVTVSGAGDSLIYGGNGTDIINLAGSSGTNLSRHR
jgi:hypothetical protein